MCALWVSQNISILMYIMCVTLCLFSAFSCKAGALQISIIVIGQTDGDDFNMAWAISIAQWVGGGVGGAWCAIKTARVVFFPSKLCMLHAYNYKSDAG